jgi:GGDEF domain-containing protein
MGLGGLELHIFVAAGVVLGCSFVAFLVDYLKGNNEKLRESTLEMAVRAEERARVNPSTGLLLQAIGELREEIRGVTRTQTAVPEETRPVEFLTFTPRVRPEPAVLDAGLQEILEREPEPAATPVVEEIYLPEMPPVEEAVPVAIVAEEPAPEPEIEFVEAAAAEPEPELEVVAAVKLEEEEAASEPEPVALPEPEPATVEAVPVEEAATVAEELPAMEEPVIEEAPVEEPSEEHPVAISEIAELVAPKVIRIRVLRTEPPVESSPAATTAIVEPSPEEENTEPEAAETEPAATEDPAALFVPEIRAEEDSAGEPEPAAQPELEPELEPAALFVPHIDPEPEVAAEEAPTTSIAAMAEAVAAADKQFSLGPAFANGLRKREEYDEWMQNSRLFTGLVVAIGVNDFAELKKELAPAALAELRLSITTLMESLLGAKDSAVALAEDEFVIVLPNEEGAAAQRRLSNISERLWDFQLRSLCTCSVVFSWGASEAKQEAFSEAAEGAFERMRETQANRKSAAFRKRAVNA